jgi:predicted GNAT family acetyltransferase
MESSSVGSVGIEVRHNAAARRFEATVDKLLCRCDYRMHDGTMMLVHTEVPPQLEGRGFASTLVRAAFDHARENGLDVLPVCSFVSAWARRHPEVEPLLAR